MSGRFTIRTRFLLDNLSGISEDDEQHRTVSRRRAMWYVLVAFLAGLLLGLTIGHFQWNQHSEHPIWKSFPLNSQ